MAFGPHSKFKLAGALLALVAAVGIYSEHRSYEAGRQTLMQSSSDLAHLAMHPAPINKDWILEGNPTTEAAEVAHTYDGSAHIYVWRTSAAKFMWHYDVDEAVTILDGEALITDVDGKTRDMKPGDVALFPVGAVLKWDVPDHVLKSAIIKKTMPKPIETAMRWLRGLKGMITPEEAFAG